MRLFRKTKFDDEVVLKDTLNDIITQVNNLAEGLIVARYNAVDAIPTHVGNIGDVVPKLTVTEAGSGYAHIGWIYGNQGTNKVWLPLYTGTATFGSMAYQNANAVAITGGTINGTTIGATTPAAITGTTINGTVITGNSFVPNSATVPSNGMYLPAANTLGWAVNSVIKLSLDATHLFSYSTWLRHGTTAANEYFEYGRDATDGFFKFNGAQASPFCGYKWQIRGTDAMRISDAGITSFEFPIKLKGYTVATLPAGAQGQRAYVTDATAPTFLGALTGGGTVVTPVFHNGTAWVAG